MVPPAKNKPANADHAEDEQLDVFVAGSRFRVFSRSDGDEPLVTVGTFLGLAAFGSNEQGVRMELGDQHGEEKGIVRVVPLGNVLYIDIVEQKRRPPTQKRDEEHHAVFYT